MSTTTTSHTDNSTDAITNACHTSALSVLECLLEQANLKIVPKGARAAVGFVASHFAKFEAARPEGAKGFDLFAELEQATTGNRGFVHAASLARPVSLDEPRQLGWVIESVAINCEEFANYEGSIWTFGYRYENAKGKMVSSSVTVSQTNDQLWMEIVLRGGLRVCYSRGWVGKNNRFHARCDGEAHIHVAMTHAGDDGGERGAYSLMSCNVLDATRFVQRIDTKDHAITCLRMDASEYVQACARRGVVPDDWEIVDGLINLSEATPLPACGAIATRVVKERVRRCVHKWKAYRARMRQKRLQPLRRAVRVVRSVLRMQKDVEASLKRAREAQFVEAMEAGLAGADSDAVRGIFAMAWDQGYAHRSKRIRHVVEEAGDA
jgi:hypothetical protein